MGLVLEPELAEAMLERLADWQLAAADHFIEIGVEAVRISDDYGGQKNTLMSPAIWRRLIRSQLARLVAHYQAAGIPVILHTCGNVTAIMDDLVELGLAAFNLQTNANDLVTLRARYGPRFCVWGGISTQSVLGCGTPSQVRAAVRHTIERLGANGGLILEPDHWVTVPPDNLDAYFDEARRCQPQSRSQDRWLARVRYRSAQIAAPLPAATNGEQGKI